MNPVDRLRSALSDRYTIEREIGAGGMATVYLARDLKHNRQVAIKVLDPQLGAVVGKERFLHEIRLTANLQHPHILPLFDSGEANGLLFYVMPYVQGETLRARLQRERQLPIDDAVRIVARVANALDYAHRQGVIHRDLKPENILLHEDEPLVMDFGIALAMRHAGGARITLTGLSLGTPQYMSPEQATGDQQIDARSDVYSLGVVLYELLVGEPPHTGPTTQVIVAKILTERPQHPGAFRDTVPPGVDAAVTRALAKVPADRFPNAAAFGAALAKPAGRPVRRIRTPSARVWLPAGTVAAIAISAVVFLSRRETPGPLTFALSFPNDSLPHTLALSSDGSQLAYVHGTTLYARSLEDTLARPLLSNFLGNEVRFSPDGKWLALWQIRPGLRQGFISKIAVVGGSQITVVDSATGELSNWGDDGTLFYNSYADTTRDSPRQLRRISMAGGDNQPTPFTLPSGSIGTPYLLPGGKQALVVSQRRDRNSLAVLRLSDGTLTDLEVEGSDPRYVPPDILLFRRGDGTVWAARFSRRGQRLTSEPIKVLDNVRAQTGALDLYVSDHGTLVYRTQQQVGPYRLWQVDRRGQARALFTDSSHMIRLPRIHPSGRYVALTRLPIARTDTPGDVWLLDLQADGLTRLTADSSSSEARWSQDGSQIVYRMMLRDDRRRSAIVTRAWERNDTARVLVLPERPFETVSIGPPGSVNALTAYGAGGNKEIWLARPDSAFRPFIAGKTRVEAPAISPDGKLLAFVSFATGRQAVHVRELGGQRRQLVVAEPARAPVWSRRGDELFYEHLTGGARKNLVAARITQSPTLDVIRRDTLFAESYLPFAPGDPNYDVFPDGQSFIFVENMGLANKPRILGITNWVASVRERLSAAPRR